MGVCFHPLLKTTKILLNNFTYMTFSNKTLTCGFYFICRYKLLESSQRCYKCLTRPFRKTTPLTTLAHFCSNYTFPNAKITKCNCFAQTHVLPQYCCILCLCWFPVFACLYADFCFDSKFMFILYFVFTILFFSCVIKNTSPVKIKKPL